jgi:hypothetical protein
MESIQIEITNACVRECSNCTRLVGHAATPFFMTVEAFKAAVDSLVGYPRMIGMMGGEPLIHPKFEDMALYLKSRIPRERCGLWSTLPPGREHFAPLIADVFGNVLLNDHTYGELYHSPILVSPSDLGMDEFVKWYHIDRCWVQNCWSASITPKGAFFCEVAAAIDMVFQGPGGWPVAPGWWKKTPKDYVEQMERYCNQCGASFPFRARKDTDVIDDISAGNLEKLSALNSPKIKRQKFALYQDGFIQDDFKINEFRQDESYAAAIAARYGLGLRPNAIGYQEPYLKELPGPSAGAKG